MGRRKDTNQSIRVMTVHNDVEAFRDDDGDIEIRIEVGTLMGFARIMLDAEMADQLSKAIETGIKAAALIPEGALSISMLIPDRE